MSDPAVSLRQVFCLHRTDQGDAAALQGLSLELDRGERACVIGPSGAGKTTLLRVIAGLETPSAGSVQVFGQDPGRISARARARLRHKWIGFLGQHAESTLSPALTAAQSVGLPLALRGASRAEARLRAAELLDATGLSERAGARTTELSGGERQRVALCAALAHRPGLLLADEPTAELDADTAGATAAVIAALAEAQQTTVLVVSHDPALAVAAQRTLWISDGRIVDERADSDRPRAQSNGAESNQAESNETMLHPGSPTTVSLSEVTRSRGRGKARRVVLSGLTADFEPGRLTAVTGPSGSGKTTLLDLLAGLDRADAGAVRLDGVDVGRLDAEALAALRRRRIGYLTQEPAPVGFLSAIENVMLALRVRGLSTGVAVGRARAILIALGLEDRLAQRVARLSGGEAQRVALAAALARAQGLLLVDEPTSRLDRRCAARVAQTLASTAAAGHTVICATHDEGLIAVAEARIELGSGS